MFKKGFTLVEVMVASSILLVGIVSLLFFFVSIIALNETNNNFLIAATDAQFVLEDIKSLNYTEINSYLAQFNSAQFNNLINEVVNVTSTVTGNLREVSVNVNWDQKGRAQNFTLSTQVAP